MTSMQEPAPNAQANRPYPPLVGLIRGEAAAQKMKLFQLAHAAGIGEGVLSRRLNGHSPIKIDELDRIAGALGYSASEMVQAADEGRSSMPHPPGPSRRTPYVPKHARRGPEIDPWNLPFDGTPEELESALWPLGVRLRAPQACTAKNPPYPGWRPLGEVDWWPDVPEIIVTPDQHASPADVIELLRLAEMARFAPEVAEQHPFRTNVDGQRCMSLVKWAARSDSS